MSTLHFPQMFSQFGSQNIDSPTTFLSSSNATTLPSATVVGDHNNVLDYVCESIIDGILSKFAPTYTQVSVSTWLCPRYHTSSPACCVSEACVATPYFTRKLPRAGNTAGRFGFTASLNDINVFFILLKDEIEKVCFHTDVNSPHSS